jgi:hypothetical protein
VHSAPIVCHRWRLARLPAPRFRSAAFGPVHIQVHGVDSPILFVSRPLDVADNGLSAFMDVDVFNRYFLLSFATVPIEGFQKSGVGPRKLVLLDRRGDKQMSLSPLSLANNRLELLDF